MGLFESYRHDYQGSKLCYHSLSGSIARTLENANSFETVSLWVATQQHWVGSSILRADGAQNDQVQKESRVRYALSVYLA